MMRLSPMVLEILPFGPIILKFGPKSRLLAPQSGAMGYGVPAAIAAKAHDPSRFVLCFAGDGDFQMNGNELGSAMQCGLQPIS